MSDRKNQALFCWGRARLRFAGLSRCSYAKIVEEQM
jgi:hypothetical protein